MKAAILTKLNAPLELRELQCHDPGFGQVKVRMLMAGICGAQLQEIRGEKDNAKYLPHLMGHEGVGIVEAVGKNVRTVKVGDKVVCHWKKGSGTEAEPAYYGLANQPEVYQTREVEIFGGGPCHTWAEQVILSENRVTSVPHDTPDELCVLLGCALSTGLGVCENDACLRMGESVLVVGCGGVGLCCIAAARAMGCNVVAADAMESKREIVFGMKQSVPFSWGDNFLIGCRFNCVIETSGSPHAITHASKLIAPSGRMVLVGQPPMDALLSFPQALHFWDGSGKRIIASQGGQFCPAKDPPRYIQAWRQGHLKIDGIVTHSYPLRQINEAIDTLKSGVAGRVVLTMP